MLLQFMSNGDREKALDIALDITQTEVDKLVLKDENGQIKSIFYIMPYQIYKIVEEDPAIGELTIMFIKNDAMATSKGHFELLKEPLLDPLLNRAVIQARVKTKPAPKKKKQKEIRTPKREPKPEKKDG